MSARWTWAVFCFIAWCALDLWAGCVPGKPACSQTQLAEIEAAHEADLLSACVGQTYEACKARPEIEDRYRQRRNDWVRCR